MYLYLTLNFILNKLWDKFGSGVTLMFSSPLEQWWKVTKYINSDRTVLKYLIISIPISCYFILLLECISEGNIILCYIYLTALVICYFSGLYISKKNKR